jgi:hypothetical protein
MRSFLKRLGSPDFLPEARPDRSPLRPRLRPARTSAHVAGASDRPGETPSGESLRTPFGARTEEGESVPLIDQAAKALDGLGRRGRFTGEGDLVFVDDVGGHVDDWRLRERFHDVLDKVGLQRLRLHDLRHTFGTLAGAGRHARDMVAGSDEPRDGKSGSFAELAE